MVRPPGHLELDLTIREAALDVAGRRGRATTIEGVVPGPLLRFREGDDVTVRVHNTLDEDTSVHWHGLLVPNPMDGVPGVNFAGIRPRSTFVYRFPLRQYGTYWYHSHSAFQEQKGLYGPLIIDPPEEPFPWKREHVVMLSDWTFEDPHDVLANLKKMPGYYNFQRRTFGDFVRDAGRKGLGSTLKERLRWGRMRMDPTDISDITAATYTYLMNGLAPGANWTGLFTPGERVRLRFINAGAGTHFDVRIPGLEMTVVQASGQHVQPVVTDEFRMGAAETYDVLVTPREERAYTIFAESADRSGYARGTLAPRAGMQAPIPLRRPRPVLTMADMGMAHEGGHAAAQGAPQHGAPGGAGGGHAGTAGPPPASGPGQHAAHGEAAGTAAQRPPAAQHPGHAAQHQQQVPPAASPHSAHTPAEAPAGLRAPGTPSPPTPHPPRTHGPGNSAIAQVSGSRLHEPSSGLGQDGWRVLVYTDLRSLEPRADFRPPEREVELHLTGNMERYMWSIDGVKFSNAKPIPFRYGERLRLTLVNDTMMEHPMHLHGMWMELENGAGAHIPRVHTVIVKPAERLSVLVTADAPGPWAFHCHILYHMEAGMFRVVQVSQPSAGASP